MTKEKRAAFESARRDANDAKRELIRIEFLLRDAGLIRKANSLSTIIANLEHWQNT